MTDVVVVTGAASGIGAATARAFAERGWLVAGLDIAPGAGTDHDVLVDVTDADGMRAALAGVTARLGRIRAAVSIAGHYEMAPVADITAEQWHRMLRVHLGGLAHLVRASLPHLVPDGDRSFVAVTSELAIGGGDGDAHYAAAKGAIVGLVRSLAAEFAPRGIRVNAVAPGPTDTPLLAPDSPWRGPGYLAGLPTRALAAPADVAACITWLADEATFCVGEILHPNSGAVI